MITLPHMLPIVAVENRPAVPIGTFLWNAKRRTIRGRFCFRGAKPTSEKFPYLVEILVPPDGLGERLDEMLAFHTDRGISAHLGRRRAREGEYLRWRFAHLSNAIQFALKFGGKQSISH